MGSIEPKMSVLVNSVYYFLSYVLIINSKEGYRLLVIKGNRLLWDKNYATLRGARISFAKHFKNMASIYFEGNYWSHEFELDKKWFWELQSKIKESPATQVHSNA